MKKIFLISFIMLISLSIFSQTKYLYFTQEFPDLYFDACEGGHSYTISWEGDASEYYVNINWGEEIIYTTSKSITVYENFEPGQEALSVYVANSNNYDEWIQTQCYPTVLTTPTDVNAGNDNSICNNSYTFSASEATDAVGTWTTQASGVSFSDIHDNNATAYNIPNGVSIFTWTAENDCGSDYDNVTITKLETPSITSHPQSQTVDEGRYVSFSVVANDANSYQWKKNGSNISGASSSTYQISSVAVSDAGTYVCEVSNDCGNITSNGAVLTVNATSGIANNISCISIYPNPSNGIIISAVLILTVSMLKSG